MPAGRRKAEIVRRILQGDSLMISKRSAVRPLACGIFQVLALALAAVFVFAAPSQSLAQAKFVFGALLPLTGADADRGKTSKAALELARDDIMSYLSQAGSGASVTFMLADTASDPQTAQDKLKSLAGNGVNVVIGPVDDKVAESLVSFADMNNILLISQGSSAQYLAKEGDNLFRLAPSNTYQAEAVTSLARQEGVTTLIPIWRGDKYGDELVVHAKARFKQLGAEALPGSRFDPDRTDFAPIVEDLKKQIDKAMAENPKTKIGVLLVAGEEAVPILKTAAGVAGLETLNWYGCDATAMNDDIAKDPVSADFAMRTRFLSPRYGEGGSNVYTKLEQRIQQKTDLFPDTQSAAAYDAAWAAFYTAMATGGTRNFEVFKRTFPQTCEHTYGVTGWLALNDHGDRREDWDFDFWTLKKDGATYFWEKAARYQFEPGTPKELFISTSR